MSQAIDRTGTFRGQISSYELREYQSKAVAVAVSADIHEAWNEETQEWEDWRQYDVEAKGDLFVIKKNGSPNQSQVEALIQYAGWNGDLESVAGDAWKPTPCQFDVQESEYKDVVTFRIAWINSYDRHPSAGGVDAGRAKELQSLFGPKLRAVAGNVKRNVPPTAPILPAPPVDWKQNDLATDVAVARAGKGPDDGVPF